MPILYYMDYAGMIALANYKLRTVCGLLFGIELDVAHYAIADILATRKLMRRIDEMILPQMIDPSGNYYEEAMTRL